MPFEPTVDSLDAVPEDARPFYRKAPDGKFNLITAESIDKLESSLGNTKRERDEAKRRAALVDQWEGLGKSADEIKALLEREAAADEERAKAAGEWDKLKAQMESNFNKERETFTQKEQRLQTALEKHLIGEAATRAIAEEKGVPTLLLPHVERRVKVTETDDGYSVVVLDDDGKTPKLNAENKPMSIRELVASMRDDETFGRAFEGSGHSGGGGTGGSGGGGGDFSGLKKSTMGVKEKTAFMEKHGIEAFQKLPY